MASHTLTGFSEINHKNGYLNMEYLLLNFLLENPEDFSKKPLNCIKKALLGLTQFFKKIYICWIIILLS